MNRTAWNRRHTKSRSFQLEAPMKRAILRTTMAAMALVTLALASIPAGAKDPPPGNPPPGVVCDKKRTIAVGKRIPGVATARTACFMALRAKGEAKYGSKLWGSKNKTVECETLGSPNGGADYKQCICSGFLCHWPNLAHSTPPGPITKSDPKLGVTRVPKGLFGTRRASPPSFRMPRIGPPTIR